MKKTLLALALAPYSISQANNWEHKASSAVITELKSNGKVELILKLENPELVTSHSADRIEKIKNTVKQLKRVATESQKPLIEYLENKNIEYKSFWVSNQIVVKANVTEIPQLLSRKEVIQAFTNRPLSLNLPELPEKSIFSPAGIEWSVSKVNAPDVWALGYRGQNIILAGQDTGYQWNHPALINRYRGWDGQNADHNYNWHDAIDNPNVVCGPEPCDDHSHGSHTMGTMTGDDGGGNQIGVAPDAKWMGCRNMNQGNGTPETYMECFQWFLEPTDLNDQNPDFAYAPHIINNSWGCPSSEGCVDETIVLRDVINNVVAAGIMVVVSAGNGGSACNTISTPPAIYDKSFTIGSTTSTDSISGFSSRGGVNINGANVIKPDVSAPGSSVRSANNNSGYTTMSGTSMAGPNAAAVAALVMSANPSLEGKPGLVGKILTRTALPLTTTQVCNGVPGSEVPNNTFGWGRVDALTAVIFAEDLIYFDDFSR
ncbi:MAG: S8 family serine peptidase [Marinicella sp.]